MNYAPPDLRGRVALVAGATRGAGRGIAVELGAAGATVYATGRTTDTTPSPMRRPESIQETARMVTEAGGTGIAATVDHANAAQVRALIDRIDDGHGRLDVLVNSVWGGDALTEWDVPFWEHDLENGLALLRGATETHLVTSWHAAPLLTRTPGALLAEVTDGIGPRYRGSLFYDLAKANAIRIAYALSHELHDHRVTALALSPGFLRSEAVLDHFGVTEATWRDAISRDPHFAYSETPRYIGRAVTSLAADPRKLARTGTATATWELYAAYGFSDVDGSTPDWGRHAREELGIEP